jgi:hypothetical protein
VLVERARYLFLYMRVVKRKEPWYQFVLVRKKLGSTKRLIGSFAKRSLANHRCATRPLETLRCPFQRLSHAIAYLTRTARLGERHFWAVSRLIGLGCAGGWSEWWSQWVGQAVLSKSVYQSLMRRRLVCSVRKNPHWNNEVPSM